MPQASARPAIEEDNYPAAAVGQVCRKALETDSLQASKQAIY